MNRAKDSMRGGSPPSASTLRLFCFPHAGGTAATFNQWRPAVAPDIELWPVQLPGHGERWSEPPLADLRALVATLNSELGRHFGVPFAFVGHSMGALIAYELTRLLRKERGPQPLALYVCGQPAPDLASRVGPLHELDEPELLEALRTLDGTPEEVFGDPELRELVLPILRADLAVCGTYRHAAGEPLDCPISGFLGSDDPLVLPWEMREWRRHTRASCGLHVLAGNHFFSAAQQRRLVELLTDDVQRLFSGGLGVLEFRNFSGDGGAVMAGVGGAASGGLGS